MSQKMHVKYAKIIYLDRRSRVFTFLTFQFKICVNWNKVSLIIMKNRQQTADLLYSCGEFDVCTLNGKILQFGFFNHSYCKRMVYVLLLFTAFKMGILDYLNRWNIQNIQFQEMFWRTERILIFFIQSKKQNVKMLYKGSDNFIEPRRKRNRKLKKVMTRNEG